MGMWALFVSYNTDRFLYLRFFMSIPFSRIYENFGLARGNRITGEGVQAIKMEFVAKNKTNEMLPRIRFCMDF